MKRKIRTLVLLLCATSGVACGVSGAPIKDGVSLRDDWTDQEVIPPQQGGPLDDYLIQLAESTDMNIIADASDFPQGAQVKPFPATLPAVNRKWKSSRAYLILDLTDQEALTVLRLEPKTILLWSEPDILDLAHLLLQEKQQVEAAASTPDESSMRVLLRDYLQRSQGWDGGWQGIKGDIKIQNLPPTLHDRVAAEIQHRVFSLVSDDREDKWFSEEFWKSVSLTVGSYKEREAGQPVPYLMLDAWATPTGWSPGLPIGRLDALVRKKR